MFQSLRGLSAAVAYALACSHATQTYLGNAHSADLGNVACMMHNVAVCHTGCMFPGSWCLLSQTGTGPSAWM